MSKVNAIRKKALECVRKQDWQNAVKEYNRLADLDQANPNVFNELGDIYLKTGSKMDAYASFTRAIDAYTRVSLHNNAVAVCKKVLRLIPARYEVLTKLGLIRKKQGLIKDAEMYYLSYFEKALIDDQIGPVDVKKNCDEVLAEMDDSVTVLEKIYECMVKFNLKDETAGVLFKLHSAYKSENAEADLERTVQRLGEIGETPPAAEATAEEKNGVVITEENIWSASHSEGERIEVERKTKPAESTPIAGSGSNPVYGYGDVQFDGKRTEEATNSSGTDATATQTAPPPDPSPSGETPVADKTRGQTVHDVTPDEDGAPRLPAPPESPVGGKPPQGDETTPAGPGSEADSQTPPEAEGTKESTLTRLTRAPDEIRVTAIIDELNAVGATHPSEDDFRSHYDLGMAYLEMDLLAEAIREYQFASKSPEFQARALEMIGLCFLKQNQANLAIKQLTKGLEVIGHHDSEALGIKYNLGLAYEMAGDFERARGAFEDVYVEDVTFRDVAEKIKKYT